MGKTHKKISEDGEFQTVHLARYCKLPRLLMEKYQEYRNIFLKEQKVRFWILFYLSHVLFDLAIDITKVCIATQGACGRHESIAISYQFD